MPLDSTTNDLELLDVLRKEGIPANGPTTINPNWAPPKQKSIAPDDEWTMRSLDRIRRGC